MPWSRWHLRMVIALGITWLLDGLEVTLAGSLASLLKQRAALGLSGAGGRRGDGVSGGEYAAINSAIDELIPASVRERVDLAIHATFWIGAVMGLIILLMRRHVPESPRWLMLRGQEDEAGRIVEGIEREVQERPGELKAREGSIKITVRDHTPLGDVWRTMVREQSRRSLLGLILMVRQSFFYNAVFSRTGWRFRRSSG